MKRFFADLRAAAAVEFSLVAPFLVLGVLSAADFGFEMSSRMEIDQALRAGAEAAIEDPGEVAVTAALVAADSGGGIQTVWSVNRYCACPEAKETSVSCFSTCPLEAPTWIYYRLSGQRDASPILLPRPTVERDMLVQVR